MVAHFKQLLLFTGVFPLLDFHGKMPKRNEFWMVNARRVWLLEAEALKCVQATPSTCLVLYSPSFPPPSFTGMDNLGSNGSSKKQNFGALCTSQSTQEFVVCGQSLKNGLNAFQACRVSYYFITIPRFATEFHPQLDLHKTFQSGISKFHEELLHQVPSIQHKYQRFHHILGQDFVALVKENSQNTGQRSDGNFISGLPLEYRCAARIHNGQTVLSAIRDREKQQQSFTAGSVEIF